MSIQRIAWLILIILFSQQASASVRMFVLASQLGAASVITAADSRCSMHSSGHSAHHPQLMSCQSFGTHSGDTEDMMQADFMVMTDHSGSSMHHGFCEDCTSSCQPSVLSSSGVYSLIYLAKSSIIQSTLLLPLSPIFTFYHPPITA